MSDGLLAPVRRAVRQGVEGPGLLQQILGDDPVSRAVEYAKANPTEAGLLAASMSGIEPFATGADAALTVKDTRDAYNEGGLWPAVQTGAAGALATALPFVGMGAIKAVGPDASRWLAESTRHRARNPRKLVNEGVRAGVIPAEQRDAAAGLAVEIRDKRADRVKARSGADPLEVAALHRERRLASLKATRPVLTAPIAEYWNKTFREDAVRWASIDPVIAEEKARQATLEAVTREARKRGLTVRHTSQDRAGRASSRYVVFPNGREVRLSDHELPDTPARLARQFQGQGGRWSGEIVVDDWRTRDMDSYFAEMLEIVSD